MTQSKAQRLVREGQYVAEVEVTLIEEDHEWAPFVPAPDVRKLDQVRLALRRGDLAAAAKLGKVCELIYIALERR